METYRLNSRVSSKETEYLIQTISDAQNHTIRSSVFSEGILLETVEEEFAPTIPDHDLLELVKNTHNEHKDEIEHLFERFREALQSSDVEQIDYLGLALMYKRMYRESEALLQRAVDLKIEAHEPRSHLGLVLMAQGKYPEAARAFERCAELKPEFADYRNNLGESLLALGSCKRAMIEFDEAITLNLYYGDAYYNKALAYILNAIRREDFQLFAEHSEKTLEMLERAVVICPEYQTKQLLQGKVMIDQGDLETAYDLLVKNRELKKQLRQRDFSSVYMKFLLASDQIDERTLTRRIKSLKEAIARHPHFCDLHHDLAVAYTLLGRFIHNKAIEEYKEALKINPNLERARKSLKLAENELKGFDALVRAITRG